MKNDKSYRILQALKKGGGNIFITLPCKYLDGIIRHLYADKTVMHVPVTREEEGIGIACGAYMAGMTPVLLIQNSGIGNSINALASLVNFYNFPMLLVLSHRGTKGEKIDAQKPMGKAVKKLLKVLNIPVFEFKTDRPKIDIGHALKMAKKMKGPVAALLSIEYWR